MTPNPIPLTLDLRMVFDQPLDHTEARTALRSVAEARRQARDWLQRALQDRADKERAYRQARATAWLTAPEGTAKAREDWVNDHTAQQRYERDVAEGIIKAAYERLQEVDAERASLHRLCDWSIKLAVAGEQPEPQGPVSAIGGRRAA